MGQTQPGDASTAEVECDRQLQAHPAEGDRIHSEHVQGARVEQDVLPDPLRAKPTVRGLGAARDAALLLGTRAGECLLALCDLVQDAKRRGHARDLHIGSVVSPHTGGGSVDDQLHGGLRGIVMLGEDDARGLDPSLIYAAGRRRPPVGMTAYE